MTKSRVIPARGAKGRFIKKSPISSTKEKVMVSIKEIVNDLPILIRLPETLPYVKLTYGFRTERFPQNREIVVNSWYLNTPSTTQYPESWYVSGDTVTGDRFDAILLLSEKVEVLGGKERDDFYKHQMQQILYVKNNLQTKLVHRNFSAIELRAFLEDKDGNLIPETFVSSTRSCLQEYHNELFNQLCNVIRRQSDHKIVLKTLAETKCSPEQEKISNAYGLSPKGLPGFRAGKAIFHFTQLIKNEKVVQIVKALDGIMGVATTALLAKFDNPKCRLLSLPGDYIWQDSKLSYHALSNAWMASPFIYYLVSDLLRKAFVIGSNGYFPYLWEASEDEVIGTMINSDVAQARKILLRNKSVFDKILQSAYMWLYKAKDSKKRTDVLFDIFMNGMESALETPNDFVKNWQLKSAYPSNVRAEYGRQVVSYHYSLMSNQKID
jgi:hypothetical protein